MVRFGSVCSGIEAASVAWSPLGWQAAWFSEIEPFPSAVLAHRFPHVPNLGSMVTLPERVLAGEVEAPDLLCGGTPCQAFSVAGLRRSLDDPRGNLSLTFCEIADAIDTVRSTRSQQPAIVFWENVPGVLSTADNAFGCLLGKLAGADCELKPTGRRWTDAGCVLGPARAVAWRILDAQYFGLAQRRRRVFVVASNRAGFDPAAVLFESEGVRRDSAPSRQVRQSVAGGIADGIVGSLCADSHPGAYSGQDAYTGRLIPHAFYARQSDVVQYGDKTGPLDTDGHSVAVMTPYVKATNPRSADEAPRFEPAQVAACLNGWDERHDPPKHLVTHAIVSIVNGNSTPETATDMVFPLRANDGSGNRQALQHGMSVRRLTPRECERLQGFPDDYTLIPWKKKPPEDCPDGPRYKALGNSWAVPVVRWIGSQINEVLK